MHFHEIVIEKEISIQREIQKILTVFFDEKHEIPPFFNSFSISQIIDSYYFRKLKCSGSYLSIKECFRDLNVDLDKPELADLIIVYEFVFTVLLQALSIAEFNDDRDLLESVKNDVARIIETVVDKIGYKTHVIEDDKMGEVLLITPIDALQEEAIETVNDENVTFSLLEYRSASCEGDLKRKRELLTTLSTYIEPLCRNSKYKQNYKNLVDDLGFVLNNLQIRHNNSEMNSVFFDKAKANLEEWYDKAYRLILLIICKKEELTIHQEVMSLKVQRKSVDK